MTKRLTKRYIISSLANLDLNEPIRYERYYINNNLRIQKKNNIYEKEVLDDNNVIITKEIIPREEFDILKKKAYKEIIRDSYLYLNDNNISIKKYYGMYEGLIRVEVNFKNIDELNNYQKLEWMEQDITNSKLAFDKDLSKLSREEFLIELEKYYK